mgnify:FL=1
MTENDILYEDNHLIVLNKRCGEIVQGDKTGDPCMADGIKDFLKVRDAKPGNVFCGVVHRLDRPVSGVCLFAKTSKALSRMNELVKSRDFHKTYWAVVKGGEWQAGDEGIVLHDWLLRNEKQNKSYVVRQGTAGAKEAMLDYTPLALSGGGYTLLEVRLHTGRHHQIRCQLSHAGMPIKGDLKYGAPRSNPDGSISLHARRVEFLHPVSHEPLCIEAPAPQEFSKLFNI